MRAKFGGQGSGPADEGCFGGRRAVELWRHERAGYVDDPTPVLRLHPRHDEISQSPCGQEIQCKGLVPERIVGFAGDGSRTAGVVDEDIDAPAKSGQGFGGDRSGTAFRTDIPDDDRRTTAGTRGQRSATFSSAVDVRPLIATCTPASASASAIPQPIPPLAAVMRAVLPSRPSFIGSTPWLDGAVQRRPDGNPWPPFVVRCK